jgi:hypothetical protein
MKDVEHFNLQPLRQMVGFRQGDLARASRSLLGIVMQTAIAQAARTESCTIQNPASPGFGQQWHG